MKPGLSGNNFIKSLGLALLEAGNLVAGSGVRLKETLYFR